MKQEVTNVVENGKIRDVKTIEKVSVILCGRWRKSCSKIARQYQDPSTDSDCDTSEELGCILVLIIATTSLEQAETCK